MSSFRLQNYFTLQIDISFRCLCLWQHHGQCVRILTIDVHCSIQCINHWNLNGWVFIQSWVWLVISDIFGIVKVLWFQMISSLFSDWKDGKDSNTVKETVKHMLHLWGLEKQTEKWRIEVEGKYPSTSRSWHKVLLSYTYNMILHEELDFTVFISCCVICYCFLVLKK